MLIQITDGMILKKGVHSECQDFCDESIKGSLGGKDKRELLPAHISLGSENKTR